MIDATAEQRGGHNVSMLRPVANRPTRARRALVPLVAAALLASGGGAAAADAPPGSNLRYDFDYPALAYAQAPTDNDISRLDQRLQHGQVTLAEHPTRGYVDALLKELHIDPSSQILIYAKTSLQVDRIDAPTPRAIYFNDTSYVAFVQHSSLIEIATVDPQLGVLFYSLHPEAAKPARFTREVGRCLTCHDTYSMMGGGTPRVLVTSAPVILPDGTPPPSETSSLSTDRTPFAERWGGWYVTGNTHGQPHLGNRALDDPRYRNGAARVSAPAGELTSLAGVIDTAPYLTDKSDVVALMVLEHQTHVQNQIVRASFKARTRFAGTAPGQPEPQTWDGLPAQLQKAFHPLVEPLAQAVLMEGAIALDAPVAGSAGYETWFQNQGPKDALGRSLRELDLKTRLFRYPLSFQLYTPAFAALPPYLKDRLYTRIESSLRAAEPAATRADRRAALEILTTTLPEFAAHASASANPAVSSR